MSTDWHLHFLSGATAGALECLALHPIDVAKTRQQLQITYRQSVREIMHTIISEGGGGVKGYFRIYRGVLAPMTGSIPKSAVWLASNERFKYWMIGKGGQENTKVRLMAGFLSALPEICVVTPFETVKIKLQSRRFSSIYKNSWDCLRGVYQQEGIRGLYRGIEATLWRNGTWNALYFASIGLIRDKTRVKNSPPETSRVSSLLQNFVQGAIAGAFATSINTPLDLVKSRIQLGVHDGKYRWAFQTLLLIAKEEGPRTLWRALPLRLFRMGMGGGVTISVYDFTLSLLRSTFPPRPLQ
uniref:Mitochondrial carrier protein n=1 Tax=Arcella intermedia TaxID=1963864 RepID=A0A6B2LC39_9EUKA